jgi:hypothetical protein
MADSTFAEIARWDNRGAEGWRIPATPRVSRSRYSLNSGDSKVSRHSWFFRRGSKFDPPARESVIVREPGSAHFVEIKISGTAAFSFLLPTKLRGLNRAEHSNGFRKNIASPNSDQKETLHSALIPSPPEWLSLGVTKWQEMERTRRMDSRSAGHRCYKRNAPAGEHFIEGRRDVCQHW